MKGLAQNPRVRHLDPIPFHVMKGLIPILGYLLVAHAALARISGADSPSQPPLFLDPKLEAAVRKYVFDKRDTDKPILPADVINISTIETKGMGIHNLTGLEK